MKNFISRSTNLAQKNDPNLPPALKNHTSRLAASLRKNRLHHPTGHNKVDQNRDLQLLCPKIDKGQHDLLIDKVSCYSILCLSETLPVSTKRCHADRIEDVAEASLVQKHALHNRKSICSITLPLIMSVVQGRKTPPLRQLTPVGVTKSNC